MEIAMSDPLAFHLTWTTYGTWLSGDSRGWVKSGEPGICQPAPEIEAAMRSRMKQETVVLSEPLRTIVDATIREVIAYRGWLLHALNVRTNHIHVVVTANRRPETVMEQLKAWCSRRLSENFGRKQKWWTEHGSTKWINDEAYLSNAIRYVNEMQ
jgi:REP element-mobilizing transposase RayT